MKRDWLKKRKNTIKELKRGNAISTFDQAKEILNRKTDLLSRLNALSELLSCARQRRISFCEIFGRRWSFVAGAREMASFDQKQELSPHWGVLVEGEPLSEEWIRFLKHSFQSLGPIK